MPCRDYYDDNPGAYYADTIQGLQKQVSFAESALYQTLAVFERLLREPSVPFAGFSPLDLINYNEAGITHNELERWWNDHKKKNAESRKNREVQDKMKAALAKLSGEERKILGLK